MAEPPQARLPIFKLDPKSGHSAAIGEVEVGLENRLQLVSVDPQHQARLERICNEVNKMPVMTVDAPPGPEAPRYTVSSRSIQRSDADFLPAMTLYLRKYYDLLLGAAAIEGLDEPFPLAKPSAAQANNPFAIDLFPKPPPTESPPEKNNEESVPKE